MNINEGITRNIHKTEGMGKGVGYGGKKGNVYYLIAFEIKTQSNPITCLHILPEHRIRYSVINYLVICSRLHFYLTAIILIEILGY